MIKIDNTDNAMVTGVLEEIPELSSLKFDFLMNYDIWFKKNDWAKEWGNNGPRCYVMLAPMLRGKVNAKIKNYIKTKNGGQQCRIIPPKLWRIVFVFRLGQWKTKRRADRICKNIFHCCHYYPDHCLH